MYWIAERFVGPSLLPGLWAGFEVLDPERVRIALRIPEEQRPCPALFPLVSVALSGVPALLGRPFAEIEVVSDERNALFTLPARVDLQG